jgi:formyl-CoA transferase
LTATGGPVLTGVRVIELANFVAGPVATMILGDHGAEVIKVELPGQVDGSRATCGLDPRDAERGPVFAATLGRNKRSVTIDVRRPEGRDLFLDLAATADVMVENFRAGSLERWGIGWDALSARNPRLILARVSGWGQSGPMVDQPSTDRNAQAFGGLMYVTGHSDRPPVPAGPGIVDYAMGMWAAMGVLLALRERDSSGLGQVVDLALFETFVPALHEMTVQYALYGRVRERTGNRYPGSPLIDLHQTADGRWLQVGSVGQSGFERLMAMVGREELIRDSRFATAEGREANREELQQPVHEWFRARPAAEAMEACAAAGVPCCQVQSVGDLMAHPQVAARGTFEAIRDPVFGPLPSFAPMPRLARSPGAIRAPSPALGADTVSVLTELLGKDAGEVEGLRAAGIV